MDLERHPALSGGRLPHVTLVRDDQPETRGRISVFLDGRELLLPEGSDIQASFSPDDFAEVHLSLLVSEVEVISWAELEQRTT